MIVFIISMIHQLAITTQSSYKMTSNEPTDDLFGNYFNKYAENVTTITLQDLDKKDINDVPKLPKKQSQMLF